MLSMQAASADARVRPDAYSTRLNVVLNRPNDRPLTAGLGPISHGWRDEPCVEHFVKHKET
jgi:hypothetical protein